MMKKKNTLNEDAAKDNSAEAVDNKENTILNNDENYVELKETANDSCEVANNKNEAEPEKDADKLEKELKETIVKLAEMQDKYLRLSAEFDNYRKRTLKEKMESAKYASNELLLKILPLMDDFDRAFKHMNESADYDGMKSGIELIYNKFNDFLKQNGVKEIESINTNFNVDIHEAVAKSPVTDDDMKGKIVDVLLKGYYLHDKILRFAKVVVGE